MDRYIAPAISAFPISLWVMQEVGQCRVIAESAKSRRLSRRETQTYDRRYWVSLYSAQPTDGTVARKNTPDHVK